MVHILMVKKEVYTMKQKEVFNDTNNKLHCTTPNGLVMKINW